MNDTTPMPPSSQNDKEPQSMPEWLYESIAVCTRQTSHAFARYFAVAAFGCLTLLGITDAQIAIDGRTVLPLFGISVQIWDFVWLVLAISTFLFLHFHVYLTRLHQLLKHAKEHYKDYEEKRIYPWFFLIVKWSDIDESEMTVLKTIQGVLGTLAVWLSLYYVGYLSVRIIYKMHDPISANGMTILWFLTMIFSVLAWKEIYITPLGNKKFRQWFQRPYRSGIPLILFMLLFLMPPLSDILFTVPHLRQSRTYALRAANTIMVEPPSIDAPAIPWGDFSKKHFENADFSRSVFKRADMTGVHLKGAVLVEAMFDFCTMRGADLRATHSSGARFCNADLTVSRLDSAILRAADFSYSNLMGCSFDSTDLAGALFVGAKNLTAAQLCKSKSLFEAVLDSNILSEVCRECSTLLHRRSSITLISRGTRR